MSKDDDTPITSLSGGYPLLQSMATELANQLDDVTTFDGLRVRRQLRAIIAIMAGWGPQNQPTKEDRKRLIDELFAAVKEASSLTSNQQEK